MPRLQAFPVYAAIVGYKPSDSEPDGLPLKEGDLVDVLDARTPDRWLCRRVGRPSQQGWVPPSYLKCQVEEKVDSRRTQEVFREDIIKIQNKEQEAIMKRR